MNKKAFTLLELLVVVLIIGILAAIALPQYKLAVLKSKYATIKDIVRVVEQAQQRFYLVHGYYTMDFTELDVKYSDIYNINHNIKFNGGYCSLNWWDDKGIICLINSNPGIGLEVQYSKGIKQCRVNGVKNRQTNSIADKICQQDTGLLTPSNQDSYSNYYDYK